MWWYNSLYQVYFKVYACLSISSLNDKLKIHSSMCMCWLLQTLNFYIHHNKNTNQVQRLYVCLLLQLSEYPLLLKVKNYLQCSIWITSICFEHGLLSFILFLVLRASLFSKEQSSFLQGLKLLGICCQRNRLWNT